MLKPKDNLAVDPLCLSRGLSIPLNNEWMKVISALHDQPVFNDSIITNSLTYYTMHEELLSSIEQHCSLYRWSTGFVTCLSDSLSTFTFQEWSYKVFLSINQKFYTCIQLLCFTFKTIFLKICFYNLVIVW